MNQSAMLARFVAETDVDLVMCAGCSTLLEQPALADLLPAAVGRPPLLGGRLVGVIAAGGDADIVLTPAAEAAYQRLADRFNTMWTSGGGIDRG